MPFHQFSRQCIHDTLMYKRDRRQWNHPNGLIRVIYNHGVQLLRSGQLAPYTEEKMRVNRILDLQTLKRAAPEIVVTIRGGLVQEVRSTNPYMRVWIADYDIDHEDEAEEQRLSDAEERGQEPDMHVVY